MTGGETGRLPDQQCGALRAAVKQALPAEISTCRPYLIATIESMPHLRAILALGRVAHDSVVKSLKLRGSAAPFVHGAVHRAGASSSTTAIIARVTTQHGRPDADMFRGCLRGSKRICLQGRCTRNADCRAATIRSSHARKQCVTCRCVRFAGVPVRPPLPSRRSQPTHSPQFDGERFWPAHRSKTGCRTAPRVFTWARPASFGRGLSPAGRSNQGIVRLCAGSTAPDREKPGGICQASYSAHAAAVRRPRNGACRDAAARHACPRRRGLSRGPT